MDSGEINQFKRSEWQKSENTIQAEYGVCPGHGIAMGKNRHPMSV